MQKNEQANPLVDAIANDLRDMIGKREEKSIYRFILPCNPKPYPISGSQHFIGTAFASYRLAQFLGMDEKCRVIAFLAGLLHDYEKLGLTREKLKNHEEVIGHSQLYEEIIEVVGEKDISRVWSDAIEIASKLEAGGLPLRLQKIARLVEVGDYLTGGEEFWNIDNICDLLIKSLDNIRLEENVVPVIATRQRLLVAMISDKLNHLLVSNGLIPLVTTPTGAVYLSKEPLNVDIVKKVMYEIPRHISSKLKEISVSVEKRARRPTTVNLKLVDNILESAKQVAEGGKKQKLSAVFSNVKSLHKITASDLIEVKRVAESGSLDDKRKLLIYLATSYIKSEKSAGSRKPEMGKKLKDLLLELGIIVQGEEMHEVLLNLGNHLNKLSGEELDALMRKMMSIAEGKIEAEISGIEVQSIIREYIQIGFHTMSEEAEGKEGKEACAICRSRINEPVTTLNTYLERKSSVTRVITSDVFHPDLQGKPETKSMEGTAKRMYVCQECNYEASIFKRAKFSDGMWAMILVYYPAISIDFLDIVREVARDYITFSSRGFTPIVMQSYATSEIIVKTSDDRGRLRKEDLERAIDLWYYLGGNMVLTTNAFSISPPWGKLPIELEKTDVFIEESVAQYMRELKVAKDKSEWWRLRYIRRTLYRQLLTYIYALGERVTEGGEFSFLKSGLYVTLNPALDVYSFVVRGKQ